jgi:hypothetical protein|tara:strand:+ start:83 stop:490 length:408 start_codon:yes stop_codon:yes gene_type:complete
MAAIDLNTVRKTVENRLLTELNEAPIIPIVFNNMPFESISEDNFVQCLTSFGTGRYLAGGVNVVAGLVLINIFTKEGIGIGSNYVIGKRIRDLYNKITVSDVIFDSPIGPEVLSPSPEGTFQTQLRITFEVYEEL